MMVQRYFLLAAINGMLVVLLGAFGAHGLEGFLGQARLEVFHTGVQYHMFHVTALAIVAVMARYYGTPALLVWSGRLFLAGMVLFAGSLYLLSITGISALGMVTPVGGVSFVAAWALLVACLVRSPGALTPGEGRHE